MLSRFLGWQRGYSNCCYRDHRATEGKSGTHIRFSDTKGRACDTDHNLTQKYPQHRETLHGKERDDEIERRHKNRVLQSQQSETRAQY